jgi:hypothetical protein
MWKWIKKYFMPEYVSAVDRFLDDFDEKHPRESKSQRKEKEKFRRIYKLRDHVQAEDKLDPTS